MITLTTACCPNDPRAPAIPWMRAAELVGKKESPQPPRHASTRGGGASTVLPALLAVGQVVLALACTCGEARLVGPDDRAPTQAETRAFVESTNDLGWGLLQGLTEGESTNIVLSPAGAALALTVIEAGSDGEARDELLSVLNGGGEEEGLLLAAGAALTHATEHGLRSSIELTLRSDVALLPAFERIAEHRLGAQVTHSDALRTPPAYAQGLAAHTVIVTRQEFAGTWMLPMPEAMTRPAPFQTADGTQLQVPTMYLSAELPFAELDDALVVELPYAGRRFSLLLVRPRGPGPLAELEVSNAAADRWLEALEPAPLELWLPRFAVGPLSHRLEDPLRGLGIDAVFDPDRADLSRLARSEQPLAVESILQHVRIDVDERGTRAEATTVATIVDSAAPADPRRVRFDRPFLFLLRHTRSGLVYFLGRVTNPTIGTEES